MKKIFDFLVPVLVILNIILIIQFQTLPNRITKVTNSKCSSKDTIIKSISDELPKKLEFIYFEGKTLRCQNINDTYKYNPIYPQEFWEGNLNLCESVNGTKYYIWSKNKLDSLNVVNGWFVTVSGLWYYKDKEYLSCLVPVVERYDKKITL